MLLIIAIVSCTAWVVAQIRNSKDNLIKELEDLSKEMQCGKDQEIVIRRRNFLLHGTTHPFGRYQKQKEAK